MPALKLLFRRTLATSTVNPPLLIPPYPITSRGRVSCLCYHVGGGERGSRLAKEGAGLRVGGAHVSKNIMMVYNNNNNNAHKKNINILTTTTPTPTTSNNNKKAYLLSSQYSSSSTPTTPPSLPPSSSEERESDTDISSSSQQHCIAAAADMGGVENDNTKQQNGVVWHQNGVVSNNDGKDQQKHECDKLLTLPTLLTLARVAAIPVFIATFYVDSWWGSTATTSIFVAAAITDWLDGYLARKMRLGTAFGAFLDPVADKLMVAATLVLLCSRPPGTALLGDLPWLFPVPAIAIIGREITMSAVREWAASQNTQLLQAVAVNNLGKWKTATQMTALTMLLAARDNSLAGQGTLVTSGVALLYISAGLAVWSLVVYMRKIWKVLMR